MLHNGQNMLQEVIIWSFVLPPLQSRLLPFLLPQIAALLPQQDGTIPLVHEVEQIMHPIPVLHHSWIQTLSHSISLI